MSDGLNLLDLLSLTHEQQLIVRVALRSAALNRDDLFAAVQQRETMQVELFDRALSELIAQGWIIAEENEPVVFRISLQRIPSRLRDAQVWQYMDVEPAKTDELRVISPSDRAPRRRDGKHLWDLLADDTDAERPSPPADS